MGDEDRRFRPRFGAGFDAARRDVIARGDPGEEKAFAGAVEHQYFGSRIDAAWEFIATIEPLPDRDGEFVEAAIHRVAAEFADMRGKHRTDERRNRMLRFADGEADRRLSRRHVGKKLAQAHE